MAYVALADTEVCDLHVVLSGAKTLVKLKRGQVLPTEFLDATDVKKSLAFGALGRLIRGGWIKEMDETAAVDLGKTLAENIPLSEREAPPVRNSPATPKSDHSFIQEVSPEQLHDLRQSKGMVQSVDLTGEGAGTTVAVKDVTFEMGVATGKNGGIGMVVAETRPELGETRDSVVDENTGKQSIVLGGVDNYETKSDLGAVDTLAGFTALNHFDQLLFIKQSGNKELLGEIADSSPKKQIQNNSRKRMSEL